MNNAVTKPTSSSTYSRGTSPWQGPDQHTLSLAEAVADEFDFPRPSSAYRTLDKVFFILALLAVPVLLIGMGVSVGLALSHGLFWQNIIADSHAWQFAGYWFTVAIVAGAPWLLSHLYLRWRYREYLDAGGDMLSPEEHVNMHRLDYSTLINLQPLHILSLLDMKPSQRLDKAGFIAKHKYYWSNDSLTFYSWKRSWLGNLLWGLNALNFLMIFLGWPFMLIQVLSEPVNTPAYIALFLISAALPFIYKKTKVRVTRFYPYLVFYRLSGMVEHYHNEVLQWRCHFSELNAYANFSPGNQTQPPSTTLEIYPRYPQKTPRRRVPLSTWCAINVSAATELWGVLQAFMNINCPLPLVLPLMDKRDKDGASRAHAQAFAELTTNATGSDSFEMTPTYDGAYRAWVKKRLTQEIGAFYWHVGELDVQEEEQEMAVH
ncbi:hypothetical protein [Pseudoalteromonas sp. T1lg88]|uniref:hypothetical protein n=1 Tax=Pseudoalteromonas sp. T1lg88 TaxID=2077104 RepID=UPI001319C89D|nr:hypothetical protein [Pseudoalteromonas sp. T1lg88]